MRVYLISIYEVSVVNLQNYFLQEICEVVSELFNVVITIIDKNFIRVAGTSLYKEQIGKKASNPFVFSTIMEKDITVNITQPGKEDTCNNCINKNNCLEKAAIYTPLKVNNIIVGGIAIIAFTEDQLKNNIFDNEYFLKFTKKLSELFANRIEAQEYSKRLSINLKEILAILNSVHDAVIAIDKNGLIYQINNSAANKFGIKKEDYVDTNIKNLISSRLISKINKEKCFVDFDDYINVQNKNYRVLITAQSIEEQGDSYGTVIILKSIQEANSIARKIVHQADYRVVFDDIVGESSEIENIKHAAKKITKSDSTVLIRGESGTGKELFARAIHSSSNRGNGPFIAINCAAIPEPLLESELFGYDDGAFTGAKRGGKIGKCELAIGGTLFLDEVGDVPISLQSKFLRMLQEKTIERVGGTKTIPVDIRIIAATNRNLEEMIKTNQFREDLYYRLNVIPLTLPPLRERAGDVITISKEFLAKYSSKLNKNILSIDELAIEALNKYSWPGNIRELENAIEFAVNMETGNILSISSLPDKIKENGTLVRSEELSYKTSNHAESSLKKIIRKKEMYEVISALDKYGWDTKGKKNAAKSLGIGIATLYRILNEQSI